MPFPKHDKALERARADLADKVQEQPLGSNTGKRVREMQSHTWLGGTGWPWCVAAWITWAEEAGFKLPYQGAGAYAYLDWARKAGWTCRLEQATPGDAVVFNIGAGHMGMLESYNRSMRTITTIDGNVSDRVGRKVRSIDVVRGVVHVPEKPKVLPPAKPPMFEVVTSESGHKVIYTSTAGRIGKRLPKFLAKHAKLTIRRRRKGRE